MPPKLRCDEETFRLYFLEALKDKEICKALNSSLFESINAIQDSVNTLCAKVAKLEKQNMEKDWKIAKLEGEIAKLKTKQDDEEQYSRRNSVRISGIEETANEDTDTKVLSIINKELKLTDVTNEDIDRSHRVGPKSNERHRSILVKFRSYREKALVLKHSKHLKARNKNCADVKDRIYINEDLTTRRAFLAREARKLAKDGLLDDTWTYDGRILIKDLKGLITQISSIDDLAEHKKTVKQAASSEATEDTETTEASEATEVTEDREDTAE